jgi:hypothetical protein
MNTQHKAVLLSMCCLGFTATVEADQGSTEQQTQTHMQQQGNYRQTSQLPVWQAAYQTESLKVALANSYHKNRPVVLSWNFPPR